LVGEWLLAGVAGAHTDDAADLRALTELDAEQQAVVATVDAYALAYAAADLEGIGKLTVSDSAFTFFETATPIRVSTRQSGRASRHAARASQQTAN